MTETREGLVPEGGASGAGVPNCMAPDPVGVIEEEHALQLELCDVLEAIADSLPDTVNADLARVAIAILKSDWRNHIALEEQCLFPKLRDRSAGDGMAHRILAQLEAEHESDQDFADEIVTALEAFLESGELANPNMLGYMLRGFFESQRRHIRWENSTVVPLARRILDAADLAGMQAWIMSSGNPWCTRQSALDLKAASGQANACGQCHHRGTDGGEPASPRKP